MFGYTLIKKERLRYLEHQSSRWEAFHSYHYWFSGFPAFYKILHGFICGEIHIGNIWETRREFGRSLGLDDWGRPLRDQSND